METETGTRGWVILTAGKGEMWREIAGGWNCVELWQNYLGQGSGMDVGSTEMFRNV